MTSIIFGITFFVIVESFFIYAIFFSNAIDWESNQNLLTTFKNEVKESGRFIPMILGIITFNVLSYFALKRSLKEPKTITFEKESISCDKNFNDLENILIKDISYIKKGFYPLILTGYNKEGLGPIIGFLIAFPFLVFATIILWITKIFINIFLKNKQLILLYPYIIVFSKETNRVLNIHPTNKKEFDNLDNYIMEKFNTSYKALEINTKLKSTSIQMESE